MTAETPNTTNHADEGQHTVNGSNVRIHLVGTDKPLLTAVAIAIGSVSLIAAIWNHQSDNASINEFSQWADLTYAREVQVDALLKARGVDTSHLPPITQPPSRR